MQGPEKSPSPALQELSSWRGHVGEYSAGVLILSTLNQCRPQHETVGEVATLMVSPMHDILWEVCWKGVMTKPKWQISSTLLLLA